VNSVFRRRLSKLFLALLPLALGAYFPALAFAQDVQSATTTAPPTAEQLPSPKTSPSPNDDLRSRVEELERRTEATAAQVAAKPQTSPARPAPIVTAEEAGFGIRSPDRAYQVRIHGQLQVDGRRFFGDDNLRDSDTFLVRRARPTIEVTLGGIADALITPDFAGGTLQLFDAFVDLHPFPWIRLRAGKFKPPIGLERLQSDNNLVFTERALDQDLSAQRDVGAQLWGDILEGTFRYEAAIFNGAPDSALNDVDSSYSKSLAGRLFIQPFATAGLRWLGRLGAGFAAESGSEKGSPAISNGAVSGTWLGSFKSVGQNTIFSYLVSTTDTAQTVVSLHRHTRLNPQLYYYFGPAGLEAEYLWEKQAVAKNGVETAVKNSAGHVTVAYVIGGDRTYEGPKVKTPFNLATGGLGALEIGARYNWLTIDNDAFPTLADPNKSIAKAKGFGFAINWYLTQSLRIAASYDQTAFTGGAKNGSATADRATEKILIGRVQVGY
jgi:phosphate-selective porin OprO and OprP